MRLGCAEMKVATWDDLAFKLIILGWKVSDIHKRTKIEANRTKPIMDLERAGKIESDDDDERGCRCRMDEHGPENERDVTYEMLLDIVRRRKDRVVWMLGGGDGMRGGFDDRGGSLVIDTDGVASGARVPEDRGEGRSIRAESGR
ncbi:hypothetical protein Tco_0703342 [Tanacetum coccineum]|uniref:Uncharacterized protein n=1 Tax=Tanacetum coccineum TaxID=301880 RepID=A0ABQ4Y025_9ASTR